jgi:hypothetical protein
MASPFLISALDVGKWSASRLVRFTNGEIAAAMKGTILMDIALPDYTVTMQHFTCHVLFSDFRSTYLRPRK